MAALDGLELQHLPEPAEAGERQRRLGAEAEGPRVSCIRRRRCRAFVTFHSYMGSFVKSERFDRVAMHVSLARPGRPRRRVGHARDRHTLIRTATGPL
jgi:hypothetical protein